VRQDGIKTLVVTAEAANKHSDKPVEKTSCLCEKCYGTLAYLFTIQLKKTTKALITLQTYYQITVKAKY